MKENYLRISILSLAFIFLFPASLNATTLKDNKNNYSIRYPNSWVAKKYPNSKDLVKGDISKGNEAGINIRIYENNQSFSQFIEWYVENFKKDIENHYKGSIETVKKGYVSIDGRKSYVITFDFKRKDGSRWILKEYLVPRNKKEIFVFQAGTEYEHKDENIPIIDKIISTLEIIK